MDLLRSCYTTRMRVFANSNESIEVYWFVADPQARLFPHPSKLRSRNWDWYPGRNPHLGEVEGAPRTWRNGRNIEGYRGLCFIGDASIYSTGLTLPLQIPPPLPDCCRSRLVAVGQHRAANISTTSNTPAILVGHERSAEIVFNPSDTFIVAIGHERSAEIVFNPSDTFIVAIGHERSAEMVFNPSDTFIVAIGHERSAEMVFNPSDTFIVAIGHERSAEITTVFTPSSPIPGPTCALAGALPLSTPYTGSITGGITPSQDWFFVSVSPGTYKGLVITNSGNSPATVMLSGTCASLTLVPPPLTNICGSATIAFTGNLYIRVTGPLSGNANYTLEIRSGSCPW